MGLTVKQLAEQLGAELVGIGEGLIEAVGPVGTTSETDVTFVTGDKFLDKLKQSKAAAVIVGELVEDIDKPQLIVKNVNGALIEALKIFAPKLKGVAEGIDPSAHIGEDVEIGKGSSIGPGVVIGDGTRVGENSIVSGGCQIGENVEIGDSCQFDSNVVIYHNCKIGNNVIIQANSTIGATGFGYYFIDGEHRLIPHNGIVVIEDFVEIGSNSCVDRAKFGETRIGVGTKIDNLVQIAHNVVIGKCCLIISQVGIAGSVKLGDGVVLAGRAGVADNIEVGDGCMIGAASVLFSDSKAGQKFFGVPAIDAKQMMKTIALTRRLPKLIEQFKQINKRIEKLEAAEDNKK